MYISETNHVKSKNFLTHPRNLGYYEKAKPKNNRYIEEGE